MTTRPLPPPLSSLETRLGLEADTLEGAERDRAEEALEDAVTLVLAEVSERTADRWASSAPRVVELVVLTAARRGYENPRGIAQETLGEHTVGLTESTGVYLTAREVMQVRRAATGRAGFTGSVRTPTAYGTPVYPATLYVPVSDSRPIPFLSASEVL
ncbi:hypothetical protein MTE01_28830 [Microbacterium testaceum]|uniref:Head-to-tail adaptor n=1 Tax=Microbacterium testaceum TaxID=2033 RepID=A0A4Y3QRA5_MICTE|nr:hypothetical protein [Microbacterium testaceum]GEB46938.1 hypothetical protein MTE01_28830 [Microbacterium testaceum]